VASELGHKGTAFPHLQFMAESITLLKIPKDICEW